MQTTETMQLYVSLCSVLKMIKTQLCIGIKQTSKGEERIMFCLQEYDWKMSWCLVKNIQKVLHLEMLDASGSVVSGLAVVSSLLMLQECTFYSGFVHLHRPTDFTSSRTTSKFHFTKHLTSPDMLERQQHVSLSLDEYCAVTWTLCWW